ncbi:MAG TPA: TlpA disulfide reductase family protein [Caldilineaceae bacterium]|nr:TlpA disulfide reductase family protein [Caldilineaceae bacterium]
MSENLSLAGDSLASNPPDGQNPASTGRRIGPWQLFVTVLPLIFIIFLAIALRWQIVSEGRAAGIAPDFEFITFSGETVRLADFRGKGVVVNFWASWCVPCRAEAPLLEATWRRERDRGIVFIGVDYLDQEHAAKAYLAEFDITYPNGPDLQSQIARHYGISGVPETFFIGPDGTIVSMVIGPLTNANDLNQRIDAIRPVQSQ